MLRESRTVFSIKMKLNLQNNGFKNVGLLIRPNKAKKLKDKIDYFFSNTQYLLALRQIHQVINYCNKVGATLYIVNFLDQAWIPLMTGTYEKFIDLQHTFNDKTFRYDMIDYAHDNEHPGPKQHQEYAKKISNFIQGK